MAGYKMSPSLSSHVILALGFHLSRLGSERTRTWCYAILHGRHVISHFLTRIVLSQIGNTSFFSTVNPMGSYHKAVCYLYSTLSYQGSSFKKNLVTYRSRYVVAPISLEKYNKHLFLLIRGRGSPKFALQALGLQGNFRVDQMFPLTWDHCLKRWTVNNRLSPDAWSGRLLPFLTLLVDTTSACRCCGCSS